MLYMSLPTVRYIVVIQPHNGRLILKLQALVLMVLGPGPIVIQLFFFYS